MSFQMTEGNIRRDSPLFPQSGSRRMSEVHGLEEERGYRRAIPACWCESHFCHARDGCRIEHRDSAGFSDLCGLGYNRAFCCEEKAQNYRTFDLLLEQVDRIKDRRLRVRGDRQFKTPFDIVAVRVLSI